MKYEIFERLNTGSVVLNPQELRNSLFRGPFNDLVHELARDEHFRLCIGTGAPRKRMVDQELVLRFFALYHGLTDYRPPLKTFLNRYMSGVQHIDAESADRLKALFRGTTARLATTFGDAAFRFIDAAGRPLDRSPNRAIFDAQMLAFAWITEEPGPQAQTAALTAMATLSEDDRFVDSSTLATGDRSRTVARVEMMVDALAGAGLPVALPAAT